MVDLLALFREGERGVGGQEVGSGVRGNRVKWGSKGSDKESQGGGRGGGLG